jgi:hypothetical protein
MARPSWYRKARIAGVAIAVPGYLALFVMYPLAASEPAGVAHTGDAPYTGPDWFPTVAIGAVSLVAVGTILVLAPLVHNLPETMRRLCEPSGAQRTHRQ